MKASETKKNKEVAINNVAIIQYLNKKGEMKILAFSDYDIRNLKHRASIHMMGKRVTSIQFYYEVSTNKDLQLLKKGVIIE